MKQIGIYHLFGFYGLFLDYLDSSTVWELATRLTVRTAFATEREYQGCICVDANRELDLVLNLQWRGDQVHFKLFLRGRPLIRFTSHANNVEAELLRRVDLFFSTFEDYAFDLMSER